MRLVGVTQRVDIVESYGERRDALDQQWHGLLEECGVQALLLPNHVDHALDLFQRLSPQGLLLTGGNTLGAYGGDAPERDETESALLSVAIEQGLPVLGVCRGMQVIQHHFGVSMHPVEGHVTASQEIDIEGERVTVNSYHDLGANSTVSDLEVWARSDDGVVKAIRHRDLPVVGVMWHPERFPDSRPQDMALVRQIFGVQK